MSPFPGYLLNKVLFHDRITLPSNNSLEIIPLVNDKLFAKDMAIKLRKNSNQENEETIRY